MVAWPGGACGLGAPDPGARRSPPDSRRRDRCLGGRERRLGRCEGGGRARRGSLEARATYVLHLEHGEWKVVQVHWSLPRARSNPSGRPLRSRSTSSRRRPARPARSFVFGDSDGTVTIVFTDIVDSTALLGRLGDPVWLELMGDTTRSSRRAPRPTAAPSWRPRATGRCSRSRARDEPSHVRSHPRISVAYSRMSRLR